MYIRLCISLTELGTMQVFTLHIRYMKSVKTTCTVSGITSNYVTYLITTIQAAPIALAHYTAVPWRS